MAEPPPKSSLFPALAPMNRAPVNRAAEPFRVLRPGGSLTFISMCSNQFRELLHRYTLPMFRDDRLVIGLSGDQPPSVVAKFNMINEFLAGMTPSDILVWAGLDTLFLGRLEEPLLDEMNGYDFRYAAESREGGVNGDFLVVRGTDAGRRLLTDAAYTFTRQGKRETDQSILSRLSRNEAYGKTGPLSLRFLNQSVTPSEAEVASCLFFHANCRWGIPDKLVLLEQVLSTKRKFGYKIGPGRTTIEWRMM